MADRSLELQESGWEELRREARKVEGDLDVKLSSYAKLGARFTQGGYMDNGSPVLGSERSWRSIEFEIRSLLEKLLDINDGTSRCAVSTVPTTSVTQKLARHREILHEFTQEFRRIRGNIKSMEEHTELLSSVRNDISNYKVSGSGSSNMQLLRERTAIHGSIAHEVSLNKAGDCVYILTQIDDVISQAQTTRAVLGSQRSFFGDVHGKVKQLSDIFPVIRGLLGKPPPPDRISLSSTRKRQRGGPVMGASSGHPHPGEFIKGVGGLHRGEKEMTDWASPQAIHAPSAVA
ncbi:hypothetical protein CDL15_Pgr028630 [Punica granatum]|uniref:Golgi SNAP receptor complex member 1 n=1 Tax=Punica granatum TaxID=22663 RepID=A0A218VX63_PUNGR|nr:hypothetical protein CDL15_Pgr028630 [Punica granatum]